MDIIDYIKNVIESSEESMIENEKWLLDELRADWSSFHGLLISCPRCNKTSDVREFKHLGAGYQICRTCFNNFGEIK